MFSGFMARTWLEATIMAAAAGTIGFFVVVRGSTFAAHAIPKGSFAGAAGASLIGVNTLVGVGIFAFVGAAAIARWGRKGREDVVTALVLVTLLGVGSLFLSMSTGYAEQVFALLFGEPLAVSPADLVPTAAIGALCVALIATLYRPLLLSSVAPELAAASATRPQRVELGFLLAVGAVTTMALPVVGALLVFSLMIGPAAAARYVTNRPLAAIGLSGLLAVVTAWLAVGLSFESNWPVGFFIGALAAAWYVAGRALSTWRRAYTR
ncbi:MAG TPA: metal ABC transporter permease [Acidimicrobiales bacterium]|nr:metal ABC transporter permease [Acidimicrobiales bacterium]